MTDKERLIEILKLGSCPSPYICDESCKYANLKQCYEERTADLLLEHGVIVPPCKVGDKVYELTTSEEIKQRKVKDIIYDNEGFRLRLEPYFSYEYYLNETVFLTHGEAAQALKERITNHRK